MACVRRLSIIIIMCFTLVNITYGCAKAEILRKQKQIDEKFEQLFSAKNIDQEWNIAVEFAQFFKSSGVRVKVYFKKANRVEYLEPMKFVADKEAVAIMVVADDIYIWKPIDRKSVDAFFLE